MSTLFSNLLQKTLQNFRCSAHYKFVASIHIAAIDITKQLSELNSRYGRVDIFLMYYHCISLWSCLLRCFTNNSVCSFILVQPVTKLLASWLADMKVTSMGYRTMDLEVETWMESISLHHNRNTEQQNIDISVIDSNLVKGVSNKKNLKMSEQQ